MAADANNIAVRHMIDVYRHPMRQSGFFRTAIWLFFGLFSLCFMLLFGDILFRISGFSWARWLLWPAWAGGSLFLIVFFAMYFSGYAYSRQKYGTPLFWKDRCKKSVQGIRKKHPKAVIYLESLEQSTFPWWWMFHLNRRIWIVRILAAALKTSGWILVAITVFWGWYNVGPHVFHRPYMDTMAVILASVELICIAGIYQLLLVEFSSWTGATNKACSTFSQAVLRQDLGV